MDSGVGSSGSWFPFCEEVTKFERLAKIGQGTFGEVWKARHRLTNEIVALKKIITENESEGFPITAIREIKILQILTTLKHENVVTLLEICRSQTTPQQPRADFYLVLEFCDYDLAGLLGNTGVKFTASEKKMIMKQLLDGLNFIHRNKVMHRDMKPANILITKKGILKVADLGLGRPYCARADGKPNHYTNRVVTLWYRPPELLLGERNYGPSVDAWGAGCIMAELSTRTPIFPGTLEQHQLILISKLCGSITEKTFPGIHHLKLPNIKIPKGHNRQLKARLQAFVDDSNALDLLDKLLTLCPVQRMNCDDAFLHDYFWTTPTAGSLENLMTRHNQLICEYSRSTNQPKEPRDCKLGRCRTKKQIVDNDQYVDRIF